MLVCLRIDSLYMCIITSLMCVMDEGLMGVGKTAYLQYGVEMHVGCLLVTVEVADYQDSSIGLGDSCVCRSAVCTFVKKGHGFVVEVRGAGCGAELRGSLPGLPGAGLVLPFGLNMIGLCRLGF